MEGENVEEVGPTTEDWPHAGAIKAAASFGNAMVECDIKKVCFD